MNNVTKHAKCTFDEFFKKATSNEKQEFLPYAYQQRIANLKEIPDILNIPTGAGKTEAVVLGIYIWRRFYLDTKISENTPRRLVYCLPMRVLVEQTVERVERWIKNLGLEDKIGIITMMGGNTDRQYSMQPEKDFIIVGTQDMLLSRALNRGYAENPFRWPVDFGLLNNDCLWVMDEIQLMHDGLTTSIQLESFRRHFGVFGPCKTIWMSATVNKKWFKTVDFDDKQCTEFTLEQADKKDKNLVKRNDAKKTLRKTNLFLNEKKYSKEYAEYIIDKHRSETTTLVIVNTVERAQSLLKLLTKSSNTKCMLVHSRFRKKEREELNKELKNIADIGKDVIIVATQVIEAGIDISAETLITEVAPWPSLVQRFGRCNRKGEYSSSEIHIIELDKNNYFPYDDNDMNYANIMLDKRYGTSVSPASIKSMDAEKMPESVIRKSDIVGLFDTSPDLNGNYTDVSMYVRSLELSSDVSVVWRDWKGDDPPTIKVMSDEICNVQINQLKKLKRNHTWVYNIRSGIWEKQIDIYPGQLILLKSEVGGYSNDIGWNLELNDKVEDLSSSKESEESINDDIKSYNSEWITLNDHTVHVLNQTKQIIQKLDYFCDFDKMFHNVAIYHDIGKAHYIFQQTMKKNIDDSYDSDEFWAKRKGKAYHSRYNYRHEAISALALLVLKPKMPMLELVAYLVAAHHGKVRLAMRNTYKKRDNNKENSKYVLGISTDSEQVPIFLSKKYKTKSKELRLIDDHIPEKITITTELAKIGALNENQSSWLSMTLNLLKKYGPFKLAMMESIIRAADTKASAVENKNAK